MSLADHTLAERNSLSIQNYGTELEIIAYMFLKTFGESTDSSYSFGSKVHSTISIPFA